MARPAGCAEAVLSTFSTQRTLRFGDCDPSGIAYFPAYFDILNGVVEEFWIRVGFPWPALINTRRIGLPTARLESEFVKPSMFGDILVFAVELAHLGQSSLHLVHRITAGEELRWSAKQVVVATDLDTHRSRPWPEDIRGALGRFMENP